jgi:hypothetical protein
MARPDLAHDDVASGRTRRAAPMRLLLLGLGAACLIVGLCGGLVRLGWPLPHAGIAALHGPLLISGAFGTLISLERAVALGRGWAYAAPGLTALGSVALILGAPVPIGAGAYVLAAIVLAAASLRILRQQPAIFTGLLLLGAGAWLTGNLLWLRGDPVPDLVGWWLGFLILTIAGERLELSRLMPPGRGSEIFILAGVGLLAAGARNGFSSTNGSLLYGPALLLLAAWLLRNDIALRAVQRPGQTRFMAACMLSGYLWLGIAGLTLVFLPDGQTAFRYDIAIHAVLIGFVLSMVFGHALIILPAVARLRVRYHAVMYAPLVGLHAALAARVAGGILEWPGLRLWSGPLVLCALAGFAACIAFGARRRARPTSE